jgi:pyruvate,water dikinase
MTKKLLLKGVGASPGKANGFVKIISSPNQFMNFRKGMILVTKMTDPEWLPVMAQAAAVITDEGGVLSHPAIVCREFGIPAVVGTKKATRILRNKQNILVEGKKGHIYER